MKRYAKFANTLPREHRNTPWAEFVPPVWAGSRLIESIIVAALIVAAMVTIVFTS